MSEDESSVEWRTVRVSGSAYVKLVELSSLINLATLARAIPLRTVADLAIDSFYEMYHLKLKEVIRDPQKFKKTTKELDLDLKRMHDFQDQWKTFLNAIDKVTESLEKTTEEKK